MACLAPVALPLVALTVVARFARAVSPLAAEAPLAVEALTAHWAAAELATTAAAAN
jgi:hypothetical protein